MTVPPEVMLATKLAALRDSVEGSTLDGFFETRGAQKDVIG